jgi:flagellar biosynthesis/type III secretory pathway M-ring protein FliF/YscJ
MEQPCSQIPAPAGQSAKVDGPPPAARAVALLRGLAAGRLLVLAATAVGLPGFLAFLALRSVEPDFTLRHGGLALVSAQIADRREALDVPFQRQAEGKATPVPADRALRLRIALPEAGPPHGGNEDFDRTSALGASNSLANVNLRRTPEGEPARTITGAVSGRMIPSAAADTPSAWPAASAK